VPINLGRREYYPLADFSFREAVLYLVTLVRLLIVIDYPYTDELLKGSLTVYVYGVLLQNDTILD
jgi:hypothetical protein